MTLQNKFNGDRGFFIGLLLMVPASFFWLSVVLEQAFHSPAFLEKVFLPMDNISPVFPVTRMLLLPFVAFIINVFSVLKISARKEGKEIKGNFSIEAKLSTLPSVNLCRYVCCVSIRLLFNLRL